MGGKMTDMELIANIKELEGKTIKKATFIDYDEMLALIFTDNSYCVLRNGYQCLNLADEDDMHTYLLRDAGVITEEEKLKRDLADIEAIRKEWASERATYERLKAKYGDK